MGFCEFGRVNHISTAHPVGAPFLFALRLIGNPKTRLLIEFMQKSMIQVTSQADRWTVNIDHIVGVHSFGDQLNVHLLGLTSPVVLKGDDAKRFGELLRNHFIVEA